MNMAREPEQNYTVVHSPRIQLARGKWHKYDVSALIEEEILVIGDGYRAKNSELSRVGIPFARAGNIKDGFQFTDADCLPEDQLYKVGEKKSRPGDTVFTSKGTVGRFAFVTDDTPRFVYSPQLSFWRPLNTDTIEPRFLHYWLRSDEFYSQFKSVASQTDMAEYVSLRDQRRMYATLPPLSEQRAIAHVLGTLDDKIELNRRMNETLEAMARALFKSWFVDFEPVRAKMEGRWHRGQSLPGLPADLYDLFPDRLVDSELGEIPEGWEVKALGELAQLNPESWSKKNFPPEVNYVDLANTKRGVIESTQPYLWKDAPSRARRVLHPGDTIVGTVRPGNCSYALIGSNGLTGSTGFAVLRPLHPHLCDLVYLSATAQDNIERLAHRADGAAYPAVRPEVVSETEVAIPTVDSEIMAWFSKTAGSILDEMESNEAESRFLAAHRNALLPRLVSGELRLENG